jgi:hypothetical protein
LGRNICGYPEIINQLRDRLTCKKAGRRPASKTVSPSSRRLGSLIYRNPLVCRDVRRRLFLVGYALRDKKLKDRRLVIEEKFPLTRGSNFFEHFGPELKDEVPSKPRADALSGI